MSRLRDDLKRALKLLNEPSQRPCTVCAGGNQHVVHTAEYARGSFFANCAACGSVVALNHVRAVPGTTEGAE